mgnify:CR=1 FL=1
MLSSGSDTDDVISDTLDTNAGSASTVADDTVGGLVGVADEANGLVLDTEPGPKTEVAGKPVT